jgi:hypothetical protein
VNKYKVTTICGSMKFYPQMLQAAQALSRQSYVVLMPFVTFSPDEQLSDPDKKMLDDMHFFKISVSDEIHVVTVDKYVGESTTRKLAFANQREKKVNYLNFLSYCDDCKHTTRHSAKECVHQACDRCKSGQLALVVD